MIRVLDSAGSTLVEWVRQQQQQLLIYDYLSFTLLIGWWGNVCDYYSFTIIYLSHY